MATRGWLAGIALAALGSVAHASALVLAPVTVVQPISVLAVPLAILITARRQRRWPPITPLATVAVCILAVAGCVAVVTAQLGPSAAPRTVTVVMAAGSAVLLAGLLSLIALRRPGWSRCVAFAAAGATAYGLVSALMRLVSVHLATGVNDLDDVGVLLPATAIALGLLAGGWSVQQAHAAGAPAVVVGCLTVLDPLVAVALGVTMLGEGDTMTAGPVLALLGIALIALIALGAIFALARHHSDALASAR